MSGEFPRVMWGGGIWFEHDQNAALRFAHWALHKGYMVAICAGQTEVLIHFEVPFCWQGRELQYGFDLKQRILNQWQDEEETRE